MTTPATERDPSPGFQATPPTPLVDLARARSVMRAHGLDAVVASTDGNLFYLAGHASDATLCHFFDRWAAALLPAADASPGALFIPEYELAYQVTRPTWLPALRAYGTEWSGASMLLSQIEAGVGIETEIRRPLRELVRRTRTTRTPDLVTALAAYIEKELASRSIRVGFDDLRLGAAVGERIGERMMAVDGLPALRRMRAVKTSPEIDLLRRAALANEAAVGAAAAAIGEGRPWADMVGAYRAALAQRGAKPLGERGMLFGAGPDGGFVLDHDYVERKRFRRGESVVLDAIAQYRLYHADMARTAVIGPPANRHVELHGIVADTLAEVEAKMRPGAHTRQLEAFATEAIRRRGLDPRLTTLVMHPIGLEIFDFAAPEDARDGWSIETCSVLNFEVFYRDPEWGGVHLEDSVLVRENGIERLSDSPRDLIIVT